MPEEPERLHRPGILIGSVRKPAKYKCGGWTGCDVLHEFLAPEDILVLTEAMSLSDFRDSHHWRQDLEDTVVANKTLFIGKVTVIPTMLGMWYEDASIN